MTGPSKENLEAATDEALIILTNQAKAGLTISYSDLVAQIRSLTLSPDSQQLADLLGVISRSEFENDRGMLSVLVVHKGGDQKPGRGFFDLAHELGLQGDDEEIWITQLNRVLDHWKV